MLATTSASAQRTKVTSSAPTFASCCSICWRRRRNRRACATNIGNCLLALGAVVLVAGKEACSRQPPRTSCSKHASIPNVDITLLAALHTQPRKPPGARYTRDSSPPPKNSDGGATRPRPTRSLSARFALLPHTAHKNGGDDSKHNVISFWLYRCKQGCGPPLRGYECEVHCEKSTHSCGI